MNDFNINKIEISPKQIFEQMKNNIYNNFSFSKYSSINKNYIYARKTLLNIMHKITNAMSFKSQTFFLAAHYLDIIFSSKEKINTNINLLGLAALCISAKYCENDPSVPHLQYFIKVYNLIIGYRNNLSLKDLRSAEVIILKLLEYKLNYYTVYDFNSFLFGHGILKFEQLKVIGNNNNQHKYKNGRNEFVINESNSMMIKNILEKIYKKSRIYLDIIINKTKLSFKYNSLLLSIYIMQKSIIEILGNEHKIYLWSKKEQEDFYKRNSLCFKEIMLEFYNIDYENNEKYKKLIIDEEIQEIFEKKIKTNNQNPAPSNINKIEEKKDNEIENNKNKTNNKENKSIFASSVSNGFYKRLKLNINMDELYKKQFELNERNTITSRNRKSNSKNNKNSILENLDIKKKINNSHSYNKRDIIKNNLINTNKSNYNIYSSNKDINRKDSSNNIIKKYSNISINNKFIPRIEAYNNFNKRRTINYMKPSENTYIERNNYSINKESNIKSESNSPIKFDVATANNNNISHISRINKFTNLNKINNGKERKDYSFSITENYNSELNKKSSEKKPYFRKLFHQNTIENYSSMNFNSTNKN